MKIFYNLGANLPLKVYGDTFKGSDPDIFIFSLLEGDQTLMKKNCTSVCKYIPLSVSESFDPPPPPALLRSFVFHGSRQIVRK